MLKAPTLKLPELQPISLCSKGSNSNTSTSNDSTSDSSTEKDVLCWPREVVIKLIELYKDRKDKFDDKITKKTHL